MRTLSSTLLSAQKTPSSVPFVKVEVLDRIAGVDRPKLTQVYTGSETEFYHTAICPADGSLIRVRLDEGSGNLYIQRIVNPGPSSNFSTWTLLNSASTSSNIAICARGSSVILFYIDATDNLSIYHRKSSDYGATWGSPEKVITPALSGVKWLAADFATTSGDVALFYVSDTYLVYVTRRVGTLWGNPTSWPHSVTSVKGITCIYQGDWNLVLTVKETSGRFKVWAVIYGDGTDQAANTWSNPQDVYEAESDSNMEFQNPFMTRPDIFRLYFVEKYQGSYTYNRPIWSHTAPNSKFVQNLWREPIPFNLTSTYGIAPTYNSGGLWLSTPSGVWQGLTSQALDITADIHSLVVEESPRAGSTTVILRNDDGRYNSPGSGTYSQIHRGSQVQVSLGYKTPAGNEVSSGPAFWIRGWEYISRGGQALFVLHARNGWELLHRWRARRQHKWAVGVKSIQELITLIMAKVGLELKTITTSSTISTQKPAFTIHPGETGARAVQGLLALVPDLLFFRGPQGYLRNPQASEASDYAYGTDHSIWEALYGHNAQEFNRVQVYGSSNVAEEFKWTEIEEVYEHLLQVHDINLDTQSKAQERAQAHLREEEIKAREGHILVPVNCGQELYDVVAITDGRAGLSAAKRRVLGLSLTYSRGSRGEYKVRLTIGGV